MYPLVSLHTKNYAPLRRMAPLRPHVIFYAAMNVLVLVGCYSLPTGGLFIQPERVFEPTPPVKDVGMEAWLWLCVLASWAAYASLQGSCPGFIAQGDGALPAPAMPAAEEYSADGGVEVPEAPLRANAAVVVAVEGEGASTAPVAPPAPLFPMCTRCAAPQPPRAHHCRACGRCVALFDHHCSLLGTCIGERNHARFWLLLAAQVTAQSTCLAIVSASFVYARTTGAWVGANGLAITLMIVLGIAQAALVFLLFFHSWLAATNSTTYETLVGARGLWYLNTGTVGEGGEDARHQDCDLAFSRGLCTNLRRCVALDAWDCLPCWGSRLSTWVPAEWGIPTPPTRDSDDVLNSTWENRWWSCC